MTPDFLVDFPGLGIFDLPISRQAFGIFGLPVYWYGLMIAGGIILGILLAIRQAPKFNLTSDDVMDTCIAVIPISIVFARLYYVVFEWKYYAANWLLIFDTRQGGLAIYGGVIGGILAILLVSKLKKKKLSTLMDFLAVYLPLGQAIGRWGNFFNQEAFGDNTSLPWGMYSNQTEAYLKGIGGTLDPTAPVHPTFLYEFIACIIIFFVLMRIRKTSKTPYAVTLWYMLLYGLVRFFVEGIRTDPLIIGDTGLRVSQLLSAVMVIGSVILLIVITQRRKNKELAAALIDVSEFVPPTVDENGDDVVFVEITDEPKKSDETVDEPAADTASKDAEQPDQND